MFLKGNKKRMSHYRLFGCAKAHSNKFRALYQPVFSLFHSFNRHWGQAAELKYLEILSVSDSFLNFWSREHLSSVVQFKETHFFIQARTFLFLLKPEGIMPFVTCINYFFFFFTSYCCLCWFAMTNCLHRTVIMMQLFTSCQPLL